MRSLRAKQPIQYIQRKLTRATGPRRIEKAKIVVLQNSIRQNNKNLLINGNVFAPNSRPKNGNAYYICWKKNCNVRATISEANLQKGEDCDVKLINEHTHEPRFQVRHCRRDSGSCNEPDYDSSDDQDASDTGSEQKSSEGHSEIEASCTYPEQDENNNSEFCKEDEKLSESASEFPELVDSKASDHNQAKIAGNLLEDNFEPEYLTQMLDEHILEEEEKADFQCCVDPRWPKDDGAIYRSLKVVPSLKFGKGVVTSVDIAKGKFIGTFYGRLCRELPEHAIYSFDISNKDGKDLFVNAEEVNERPLLA